MTPSANPSAPPTERYTHGHHASVLRSHRWRTAENSAGYVLPHLRPDARVLDVGCGPGTITAGLAGYVCEGHVIGVDNADEVVEQAREENASVANVEFARADIYRLPYPDDTFDVVHAHQVLQHLAEPVAALREMRRVARPGGLVAARDSDYGAMCWYPADPGLDAWRSMYDRVARANGGEPDAGRRLHAWAREAGLTDVACSSSTWTYASPVERAWWSELWAERTVRSAFAEAAPAAGVTADDLQAASATWLAWGVQDDAWFMVPSAEILCRV